MCAYLYVLAGYYWLRCPRHSFELSRHPKRSSLAKTAVLHCFSESGVPRQIAPCFARGQLGVGGIRYPEFLQTFQESIQKGRQLVVFPFVVVFRSFLCLPFRVFRAALPGESGSKIRPFEILNRDWVHAQTSKNEPLSHPWGPTSRAVEGSNLKLFVFWSNVARCLPRSLLAGLNVVGFDVL